MVDTNKYMKKTLKRGDPAVIAAFHAFERAMEEKNDKLNTNPAAAKTPILRLNDVLSDAISLTDRLRDVVFEQGDQTAMQSERPLMVGLVWKSQGKALFEQQKYAEARDAYMAATRRFLALPDSAIISPTVTNPGILQTDTIAFVQAVMCISNIAQCYVKEGNRTSALDWLEELSHLYVAYGELRIDPPFAWKDFYLALEEFLVVRLKTWARQAQIYGELGNSAAAHAAHMAMNKYAMDFFPGGNARKPPPAMQRIKEECDMTSFVMKRHPDPASLQTMQVIEPSLQVRGVWKKLAVDTKKGEGPASRVGFASIVHNGVYYVFGGEHATGKRYRDGWALNLRDVATGWRRVEPSPGPWIYFHRMTYGKGKGYLFQGSSILCVFDPETEQWSQVSTTTRNGTPWRTFCPGGTLIRYSVEYHDEKIYVFGGSRELPEIGRNLFMVLDLSNLKWDILGGTLDTIPDIAMPCLRQHAASWVLDGKMYIALGSANRTGALAHGKPHGASEDFSYRDMWSFDFSTKKWTREKYLGNPPCLRSEVAFTFNQKWNHAVVFGGYCDSVPFYDSDTRMMLEFSYFADTFLWSAETKRWLQVITRCFPAYRALGNMVTDQETGRTFLFAGCELHLLPHNIMEFDG